MKSSPKALATVAVAGLLLVGCSADTTAEVSQLTIVTTPAVVDHATAMVVAEYLQDQGTAVDIQRQHNADAVFDALEAETPADHAVIGVVTARQEAQAQEAEPQLPDEVDMVVQAPAELELTAATSTITAAQMSQAQQDSADEDTTQPLAAACAELTWIHGATRADEVAPVDDELAAQGCEPVFETTDVVDDATYLDITNRLKTEPDTVAMLYSVDPVIVDQGLTSLELETESWPRSNVVAVTHDDLDAALDQDITTVLENVDSDAATALLRGYHDARDSESDLAYDVEHALRYWLAEQDLLDRDEVLDISTDSEASSPTINLNPMVSGGPA